MAPMVRLGTRPGPSALHAAASRGECLRWPSIGGLQWKRSPQSMRFLQSRCIATNAAVRETGVEFPSNIPPGGIPPAQTPSRQIARERIQAIENAKPFSDFLTDNFKRQHDYLRISITERCNLRCLYCMPEEGIPLSPPATMLTTPEIFYLSSLFVSQGVTKIRLTGGEPTVRRDIVPLMQQIGSLRPKGLRELALTTNGISLHRKLDAMVDAGLTGINLSLDTLDPFQFQIMTRRKGFDAVMKSIDRILEMNKLGANVKLKVNCVVMRGLNEREILPFVEMGREKDIEVRFIEYMPFGGNKWSENKMISFQEMVDIIRTKYPGLARIPGHKNDTSKTYQVPGFVGKVGFITSMTNDFCNTCNRLRITSDGNLKVCLHGNDEVSLRDLVRKDNNNEPIDQEAFERIKQIEMDRASGRLSDSTTLGWGPRERELLSVIGQAVKRKAEKHADMGDLANMQNRPMILIDQQQRLHLGSASKRLSRRLRSAQTATNLLATNAYLNPLLETSLSSVRAFSTNPSHRADSAASDACDPVDDEIKASIERKHQASLSTSEGRADAAKIATRIDARAQREKEKAKSLSPKAKQDSQRPQLLRELLPGWTPSADAPKEGSQAFETLVRQLLTSRLADLEACLKTAMERDWSEVFRMAQREHSYKDLVNGTKNLSHAKRVTYIKKAEEKFGAAVEELRKDKKEHKAAVEELQKTVASLRAYLTGEKIVTQGPDNTAPAKQVMDSEQKNTLSETKNRKEELLRKKDELMVRIARLKAAKQGEPSQTNRLDLNTQREQTEATARAQSKELQGKVEELIAQTSQSNAAQQPATPPQSPNLDPPAHREPAAPLKPESLRVYLPGGKLKIDDDLTIDTTAPPKDLRRQLSLLRERLRAFHPPLDDLPVEIDVKGRSNPSKSRYILKTWLRVLVGRYQAKTGVQGVKEEGAERSDGKSSRVEETTVSENVLSEGAEERAARRWNERFAKERGKVMPVGKIKQEREKEVEQTKAMDEEAEDYNEMRFLEDEYATEEEVRTANEEPDKPAQASSQPAAPSYKPSDHTEGRYAHMEPYDIRAPSLEAQMREKGLLPAWALEGNEGVEVPRDYGDDEAAAKGEFIRAVPSKGREMRAKRAAEKLAQGRAYSTSSRSTLDELNQRLASKEASSSKTAYSQPTTPPQPSLPHLTSTGSAHMVSISSKSHTTRTAIAVGTVYFSNPTPLSLITSNSLKKGDVLSVSRIAGIMAAKKCPDIVPLCHPIPLTHVGVELRTFPPNAPNASSRAEAGPAGPDNMNFGGVQIECKVACTGATGVEMEALTAVMGTALSVVDMCKAVDKFQRIGDVRVVLKEGGKSGVWREEGWRSWQSNQVE